ncbi:MAG: hypothetical protein KAT17_06935 [Candidatus Aminicenantes bacterium]|nr:hypothetical protein [Candidatus Aminicenantes bacterium]
MKNKIDKAKKFMTIKSLIKDEKRKGMVRFKDSPFEDRLFRKIKIKQTRQKHSRGIHRKILYASMIGLLIVGIGLYFFFNSSGTDQKTEKNSIEFVLNRILLEERGDDPSKIQREDVDTIFEISLEKTLYSIQRESINFEEFTALLAFALLDVYRDYSNDSQYQMNREKLFLNQIKMDLDEMRHQNNYSKLLREIIKTIKEG